MPYVAPDDQLTLTYQDFAAELQEMLDATPPPKRKPSMTVIVPSHNEGKYIGPTVAGVQAQTRQADRLIVVPNNCEDNTATMAHKAGAEVWTMPGHNPDRKSGALNYALDRLLPGLHDDDLIMCMDGDTIVHPDLLRNAAAHFAADPHLGAVSSNHLVSQHTTLVEIWQSMEYERDRRFIGRRKGRYGCMTGMAAVYRVAALREVKALNGWVYDARNWTEDWRLTMDLKRLGWNLLRPQDCLATTVPVSSVRRLFRQRERWARGYLQTLMQFGITRQTIIPWAKQLGLAWSVLSRLILFYLLWTVRGHLVALWMLPVVIILTADAVNTVHRAGWRPVLVALCFPLEIFYAWLITAAIASGYFKQLTGFGKDDTWVKVRR